MNYDFNRVSPYLTSSEFVTVFTGRKQRALYRFNPDLTKDQKETILKNLRFGANVEAFLNCGDLLNVKAKPIG